MSLFNAQPIRSYSSSFVSVPCLIRFSRAINLYGAISMRWKYTPKNHCVTYPLMLFIEVRLFIFFFLLYLSGGNQIHNNIAGSFNRLLCIALSFSCAYKCRMEMHLERVSVCNSANKLSNQVERALRGCYHINVNKHIQHIGGPKCVYYTQRTYFRVYVCHGINCFLLLSGSICGLWHTLYACASARLFFFLLSIRRCDECNHIEYLQAQKSANKK